MKKMVMVALLVIVSSFAFAGIEDRIVGAWIDITSNDDGVFTFAFSNEDSAGPYKKGIYSTIKKVNGAFEPVNKLEFEYYIYQGTVVIEMKDRYQFKNGKFEYTGSVGKTVRDAVSIEVKDGQLYLVMGENIFQKVN